MVFSVGTTASDDVFPEFYVKGDPFVSRIQVTRTAADALDFAQ